MKRWLSFLLILLMLAVSVPYTAVAETTYSEGNYYYTVSGGKATIVDAVGSIGGTKRIPATLGGYPVTAIGDWAFYDCIYLTNVILPNDLLTIGEYAFGRCDNLTSITIKDQVTTIGGSAFYGCRNLKTVKLGSGIRSIGQSAFRLDAINNNIYPLTEVYYNGNEDNWDAIAIGGGNQALLQAENYYFSEHIHRWASATCTTPITCTSCGETDGEALGHVWREATCTAPITCTRCGAATGKALGHGWLPASCTEPMTCRYCGVIEGRAHGHNYVDGACIWCKDGSVENEPADGILRIGEAVGQAGDTVTVVLSLWEAPQLKSLAITNLTFDRDKLEVVNGAWQVNGTLADFDPIEGDGVIAFATNTDLTGGIFTLTLRIKEGAVFDTLPIRCEAVAATVENGVEIPVALTVEAGEVKQAVCGDVDGNNSVDVNDAVYLLYHTLLPAKYPLAQNGDVDKNGQVNSDDAIYLLYHATLPEQYPLM